MNKKEDLILIGGGGHAKACIDVILATEKFNIIGYLDCEEPAEKLYGIEYLGTDDAMESYAGKSFFIITVGQIATPDIRIRLYNKLRSFHAGVATVISPAAYVSKTAQVGEGTIIMHGAVVQFNARIGNNCIINDRALLEHDAITGDHCHVSTGAILNGDTRIGDGVFVGSGSVLRQGIRVENNAVIGSASNVIADVTAGQLVFGNPAKPKNK